MFNVEFLCDMFAGADTSEEQGVTSVKRSSETAARGSQN